jgi:hypothetical protein
MEIENEAGLCWFIHGLPTPLISKKNILFSPLGTSQHARLETRPTIPVPSAIEIRRLRSGRLKIFLAAREKNYRVERKFEI